MKEIDLNMNKIKPIESNPKLKSYFCPHCQKLLMKGEIKRLKMTCPICQRMIDANEEDLVKSEFINGKIK